MPAAAVRRPSPRALLTALFVFVAAAAVLGLQVSWTWPYFSDDSFISLRYAERLLQGHGLTWTDGERVEGYSNLLWVLGCAALGGLGLDLVAAARLLGLCCGLLAIGLVVRAFGLGRPQASGGALAAAGTLAASPTLAVWTTGGLEGSMVLCLSVWGALRLRDLPALPAPRAALRAGLPWALLCLTRPDGPLPGAVAGAVLAATWFRRGGRAAWWPALALAALPAMAVLGQLVFRLVYYGDHVPNTAHVKVALSGMSMATGLDHVRTGLGVHRATVVLGLLGLFVLPRAGRGPWLLALGAAAVAVLGYLAAIGGDHFLGWRHFAVPVALMAVLGGEALRQAGARSGGAWALALLLGLGLPALQLHDTRSDNKTGDARTETWEWDGEVVGRALGAAFGGGPEPPLLAVDAAGAVPFFSRLPCLDMLGLNDRHIARHPSDEDVPVDRFVPGHMNGNGDYVMDRAPDLLLFGPPPGLPLPVFLSAVQFEDDPRFLPGHRCVLLSLPPTALRAGGEKALRTPLWVRLAGRAGVLRDGDTVTVPAWLCGSYRQPYAFRGYQPPKPGDPRHAQWNADVGTCAVWFALAPSVAVPGPDGRLELELRARDPAVLSRLELPAGRWRLAVEPPGAAVGCRQPDGAALPMTADGGVEWTGGALDLVLHAPEALPLPVRARAVVLRRQP